MPRRIPVDDIESWLRIAMQIVGSSNSDQIRC